MKIFMLAIGWLVAGLVAIQLTVKFGNKSPIGLGAAVFITALAPITLPATLLLVLITDESICIANCETK